MVRARMTLSLQLWGGSRNSKSSRAGTAGTAGVVGAGTRAGAGARGDDRSCIWYDL
jgi:cysteine sulfinate desulfinase/cysteine desulfurase-like protein